MRQSLVAAHRDVMVVATLVSAMGLLIWHGSSFVQRLAVAEGEFSPWVRVAAVALCLNVALILFGWRRYADLQHETEKRIEGECAPRSLRRPRHDRPAQSQGFGDKVAAIADSAAAIGHTRYPFASAHAQDHQ